MHNCKFKWFTYSSNLNITLTTVVLTIQHPQQLMTATELRQTDCVQKSLPWQLAHLHPALAEQLLFE